MQVPFPILRRMRFAKSLAENSVADTNVLELVFGRSRIPSLIDTRDQTSSRTTLAITVSSTLCSQDSRWSPPRLCTHGVLGINDLIRSLIVVEDNRVEKAAGTRRVTMGDSNDPNAWAGLLKWSLSHHDGTAPSEARDMSDEVSFPFFDHDVFSHLLV